MCHTLDSLCYCQISTWTDHLGQFSTKVAHFLLPRRTPDNERLEVSTSSLSPDRRIYLSGQCEKVDNASDTGNLHLVKPVLSGPKAVFQATGRREHAYCVMPSNDLVKISEPNGVYSREVW